ncbi:MAG: hypothetical protein JKY95_01265 [Planctomycetaceae bacterium]|nr:hypothetical protein [Planctomycetaceae bacterium]
MAADTFSPANNHPAEPTASGQKVRSGLFRAIIVTFIWLGILAVLSLWTANPVTVNLAQVRHSHFILTGRIVDAQAGSVEIESLKRIDNQPVDKTLLNQTISLHPIASHWKNDTQRIFPVYRDAIGNWNITPAPLENNMHIDYPATEKINNEIDLILKQPRSN